MYRIKQIEYIFQTQTAFSIIESDGKEGQGRGEFPQESDAAGNDHQGLFPAEDVQHRDAEDADGTIVRPEEIGGGTADEQDEYTQKQFCKLIHFFSGKPLTAADLIVSNHGDETEKTG